MDDDRANAVIARVLAAEWNNVLPEEIAWSPYLVAEVRANHRAGDDHVIWDPSVNFAVPGIELLDELGDEWSAADADEALARCVNALPGSDAGVTAEIVQEIRVKQAADSVADFGSPWLEYVAFGVLRVLDECEGR